MYGNKMLSPQGSFFRLVAVLAVMGFSMGACADLESRDDEESEALAEEATDRTGEARATRGTATRGTEDARATEAVLRAVPADARLVFEVRETLSTSSHEVGDVFALRLTEDVRGSGGLVLPAGTPARGVVTAAETSEGPEDEAVLGVRIESIRIDGRDRALNGRVESAEVEAAARDSGARSVAKVATGAAAGAILGQILGRDTRSTVSGAAVGAAAGLGVALTTRDGHATLHEGTLVTVRLEDALVVN